MDEQIFSTISRCIHPNFAQLINFTLAKCLNFFFFSKIYNQLDIMESFKLNLTYTFSQLVHVYNFNSNSLQISLAFVWFNLSKIEPIGNNLCDLSKTGF